MLARYVSLFMIALLAALCVAPSAAAQETRATREARRQELFEIGLEAARQRNYQIAYRNFRDSENAVYNSDVRPESMYNLALAAAQLPQHELRAIAGFKAYLIAVPDAENAGQVRREIRRLQVVFETRFNATLDTIEASVPLWFYRGGALEVESAYVVAYLYMGQPERAERAIVRSYVNRERWIRDADSRTEGALASYRRGRTAPEQITVRPRFRAALFEYEVEAGDLTAARASLEALQSTSALHWARLGCAARAAGDEALRTQAVTRIADLPFDTFDRRREIAAMLAELDEAPRASSLVQQAPLSESEAAALRQEIEQRRACSDGWWAGQNRYVFFRNIALRGVTDFTVFRDASYDDTSFLELIESRRSLLTSSIDLTRSTMREETPMRAAHSLIAHYAVGIARAYRNVHGPFD